MAYTGEFEDAFGLASFSGDSSSRAYWKTDGSGNCVYDHDDTTDFIFLSNGKSYTDIKTYTEGTITSIIHFKGNNLDLEVIYDIAGYQATEYWRDIFSNDLIKWDNTNTDLASPLKSCDGYLNFSTGNMSFNPHIENGDIKIQTVSGKHYVCTGFIICLESELSSVKEREQLFLDNRISCYKQAKVMEFNNGSC